jgi:hypothetical protein
MWPDRIREGTDWLRLIEASQVPAAEAQRRDRPAGPVPILYAPQSVIHH